MQKIMNVTTNEIIAVTNRKNICSIIVKKGIFQPNLNHSYTFFANQKFPFMPKLVNKVL